MVEKDERFYGRGTTDMKGFLALALAAVPKAFASGIKKPLQIAFSRDEEIGLLGPLGLVKRMRENLPDASAVIIGEPTKMSVVSGHKGCDAVEVTVHGFEVHSSKMHEGVSVVMIAAQYIEWLRGLTEANRAKKPDPIVADVRTVPSEDGSVWIKRLKAEAKRIETEMKLVAPDAFINVHLPSPGLGLEPEENGAAEQLTGDNGIHTVSYDTDGGYFQGSAIPGCVRAGRFSRIEPGTS